MRSTEACYVNKTYVEALGYTLPDDADLGLRVGGIRGGAAAKNADGTFVVNGQQVLIPFIYKSTDNMMIQMLRQTGRGLLHRQRRGAAVQRHHGGAAVHHRRARTANGAFSTFKISGYPANFLNAGPVHVRHRLHRRRHLDGHRRAADATSARTSLWPSSTAVLHGAPVRPRPSADDLPGAVGVRVQQGRSPGGAGLVAVRPVSADQRRADSPTPRRRATSPSPPRPRQSAAYQDYLARGGEDDAAHYAREARGRQAAAATTRTTPSSHPCSTAPRLCATPQGQLIENVDQVRAPQADGGRRIYRKVSLRRRFVPLPPGPDARPSAREGGLRAAARRFRGAADRSGGLLGRGC